MRHSKNHFSKVLLAIFSLNVIFGGFAGQNSFLYTNTEMNEFSIIDSEPQTDNDIILDLEMLTENIDGIEPEINNFVQPPFQSGHVGESIDLATSELGDSFDFTDIQTNVTQDCSIGIESQPYCFTQIIEDSIQNKLSLSSEGGGQTRSVAISFTISNAIAISTLEFYYKNVGGTATGNAYITIPDSSNDNKPDSNVIIGEIINLGAGNNSEFTKHDYQQPLYLEAGIYWLVMNETSSINNDYFNWFYVSDLVESNNSRMERTLWSSPLWGEPTFSGDLLFQFVYFEPVEVEQTGVVEQIIEDDIANKHKTTIFGGIPLYGIATSFTLTEQKNITQVDLFYKKIVRLPN